MHASWSNYNGVIIFRFQCYYSIRIIFGEVPVVCSRTGLLVQRIKSQSDVLYLFTFSTNCYELLLVKYWSFCFGTGVTRHRDGVVRPYIRTSLTIFHDVIKCSGHAIVRTGRLAAS